MYNTPLFASKQTFARIDFCGKASRCCAKTVLIVLNFVLNILHNSKIRPLSPLTRCCEK